MQQEKKSIETVILTDEVEQNIFLQPRVQQSVLYGCKQVGRFFIWLILIFLRLPVCPIQPSSTFYLCFGPCTHLEWSQHQNQGLLKKRESQNSALLLITGHTSVCRSGLWVSAASCREATRAEEEDGDESQKMNRKSSMNILCSAETWTL